MSMTLYVLDNGRLFKELFDALAAFMNGSAYARLISLATAFGFFVAVLAVFKNLNPTTLVKWFVMYIFLFNIVMIPRTTLVIYDMSKGSNTPVANVPTAVAFIAELMTGLGTALAKEFDSNFAMPDSLQYSKTGFLFGSRIVQEARDFKITNPELKANMDRYFRQCVVGDLYLNRVLSPTELKQSSNIWKTVSTSPSIVRRVIIVDNGSKVDRSCKDATPILKKALDEEVKAAYSLFGYKLFGARKPKEYETLLNTNLTSAFNYYQAINTTASQTFLQSMMLNVVNEGIDNYPAYLQSSSSVINHQFTKSQVQQAYTWQIGGMKAAWFLPFFQSVLMFLLVALFPLIVLFMIAFNGWESIKSYLNFFLSIQLWPVCFAILNLAMAYIGQEMSSGYGAFSLNNLDNVSASHANVASMAGYMMVFIPWLCFGLTSKAGIGERFSSLSTSMLSGIQNSTMTAASEAANASFSLGNTSFYNANGNNLSANKNDTNFTSLHGNTTRQLDSGALVTTTSDGSRVFDGSPTMSKSAFSINGQDAIHGALNNAAETNTQAITGQSVQYGHSLNNSANDIIQLSEMSGKDLKLGEGVSSNDSSHLSKAVSNISGIAEHVAERTGVNKAQALTGLINAGIGGQIGAKSEASIPGKIAKYVTGADGSVYAKTGMDFSDSTSRQSNHGYDKVLDAKEMRDFKNDIGFVNNFSQSHHLDTSHSEGANLLEQTGHDLRSAENISNNLDASLSQGQRISTAKNVTESSGATINQSFDQMFQEYVVSKTDANQADELFGHPGSPAAQSRLHNFANDFINDSDVQKSIISQYGNSTNAINPSKQFAQDSAILNENKENMYETHANQRTNYKQKAEDANINMNKQSVLSLQNKVNKQLEQSQIKTDIGRDEIRYQSDVRNMRSDVGIKEGQQDSKTVGQLKQLLAKKGEY